MSTFNCEYCGSLIDTATDDNCPNCGASYSDNPAFLASQKSQRVKANLENQKAAADIEKKKEEIKRQKLENQDYQNRIDNHEKAIKTSWKAAKIVRIIAFCALGAFFLSIIIVFASKSIGVINEELDRYKTTNPPVTEALGFMTDEASFNKFANNGVIKVKVDEFEEFDPYPYENERGYVSVAIHFVVENVSKESFYDDSEVTVLADGYLAEKINSTYNYKLLRDTTIPSGAKYDGYLLYKIPTSAEEIEIKYGDYITLIFDNPVKE